MRERRHGKPQKVLRLSRWSRSPASRNPSSAEMSFARVTEGRPSCIFWQPIPTSPAVQLPTWLAATAPAKVFFVADISHASVATMVHFLMCNVFAVLPIQLFMKRVIG